MPLCEISRYLSLDFVPRNPYSDAPQPFRLDQVYLLQRRWQEFPPDHADRTGGMRKILIAEDDPSLRDLLAESFREQGEEVVEVGNGIEAVQRLETHIFDLIISELRLPDKSGIDVLRVAKSSNDLTPVIVLTGDADVDAAVEALKVGAYDYLLKRKPFNLDELHIQAAKALECCPTAYAIEYLRHIQPDICDFDHIIGHASQLQTILSALKKDVSTTATILITGEPGTRKKWLAGAIHANSPRRHRTFVKVNCGGLHEHLLESELFGHEQGAFPGADFRRIGCFEHANLGTLLLEKIEDMSPGIQAKILRVLQGHEFERLGSSRTITVDVRVIVTANRGVKQAVREGRIRPDLYARLNVVSVEVPPLRERSEDIIPLAHCFRQQYNRVLGRRVKGFDAAAGKALVTYRWPGNMWELENTVARGVLLAEGEVIGLSVLGIVEQRTAREREPVVKLPPRGVSLKEIEKQAILQALQRTKWVQKDAAALLDISPRVMNYKLKMYGITHPKRLRGR